jgi:hypothetical protein
LSSDVKGRKKCEDKVGSLIISVSEIKKIRKKEKREMRR